MGKKAVQSKTKKKVVVEPRQAMTQAQLIVELAARSDLASGEVRTVFTELQALMDEELFGRGGSRQIMLPMIGIKILLAPLPALPEREGRNPATGKTIMLKPRPAGWKLRARFMKLIKEGLDLMEPPVSP